MGIESFFTLQAFSPNQGNGTDDSGSAAPATGLPQSGESNFLDFILSRIAEVAPPPEENAETPESAPEDTLSTDIEGITTLKEELAALEKEIEDSLNKLDLDIDPDADPVLAEIDRALKAAEAQREADNILLPTSDGIITVDEINRGGTALKVEQELLAKEEALEELLFIVSTLRKDIENAIENGGEIIIANNLTPVQLTQLETLAKKFESNEEFQLSNREQRDAEALIADISAVFVRFNDIQDINLEDFSDDPVLQNALAILQQVQSRGYATQQSLDNAPDASRPQGQVGQNQINITDSRLNGLITGGSNDAPFIAPEGYEGNVADFEEALRSARPGTTDAFENTSANTRTTSSADLSTLQNLSFAGGPNTLTLPATNSGVTDPYITNLSSGATLGVGTVASTITQAASANLPHPALPQVAVNIQRAAGAGGNQDFTVRLDPPELGRLRVDLSFGRDGLSSTITAERPETYLLFQRDAGALERLLQDLGLDTDGGVNFELAGQDFDFDGNNNRGGGHERGGTGASGDSETEEIIETSVTWHIDPQTGLTRYDFLA